MAKRRVFFSFHYAGDAWRTNQVRNAGVVEGDQTVSPNQWEEVKRRGDKAIKAWIDAQLATRSCAIVLIGAETSTRRWIRYEIERAWNSGKGVIGVHVHNLKDEDGDQSQKGVNLFEQFTIGKGVDICNMADVVKAHDPPTTDSKAAYRIITEHLAVWVEEAIEIRREYGDSHARHIY